MISMTHTADPSVADGNIIAIGGDRRRHYHGESLSGLGGHG